MGVFKNFLMRQVLKAKLKDAPEAQREMLMELIEKHPNFFKKISDEIKKKVKSGQSEMAATMVVMREHQSELQKLLK